MSKSEKYPYLNLIKRPLDDDQSEACFTVKNAVVAAGAGSGKTQVLATRFAWLVMSLNIKAGEILTLTFTDKAASEMYRRIYDTLKFFAEYKKGSQTQKAEAEADLTEEKINRAKEALKDFSNTHIQTLDSYCAQIVRQCANRYGLTPDFQVASADAERDIKNEAFKFLLKNIESDAVKAFVSPGALQTFAENVFAFTVIKYTTIATEKGYFLEKLKKQAEEITAVWNYIVTEVKDSRFKILSDNAVHSVRHYAERAEEQLAEAKITPANEKYKEFTEEIIELSQNLKDSITPINADDIENDYESVTKKLEQTDRLIALVKKLPRSSGIIQKLRTILTTANGESLESDALKYLEMCSAFLKEYRAIKSLNILFEEFTQKINASKRRSGSLTFSDVTALALKILLENEDVRVQEENAYKKIMIDEFQDNNGKNRDLLYLIALKACRIKGKIETDQGNPHSLLEQIIVRDGEDRIIEDRRDGEKLFFVGDEKQSIYKFRGADVTVFNELTDTDPCKSENSLLSMTYNYRSDAELLTSFNLLFRNGNGIFKTEEERELFDAGYKKDAKKNGTELPELDEDNVRIHFCYTTNLKAVKNKVLVPADRRNFIPQKEQAAFFMAQKIAKIARFESMENPGKKTDWSSFAILERSRSDARIITKYLSMFNIPFKIDQFANIFEDAVINDFYNFLRICVYPSDINAFAAYLCSPFAGLTENETEIVLSHLTDIKDKTFVFDPLKTEGADEKLKGELKEESFNKFIRAREFYKQNQKKVLRQNLTDTLAELWNIRGYTHETMLGEQQELCAEHFDMLFELARTVDDNEKSPAWFVDELEKRKKESFSSDSDIDTKNVSYPLERGSAVQIMTIHKSKGLQFDHVFIWGCTNPKSRSQSSLCFFDEENGVSVKAETGGFNYFYEKQKGLSSRKETAELRRIIYVAVTRAVKDAFIMGEWNFNDKGELTGIKNIDEKENRMLDLLALKYYPKIMEGPFAEEENVFAYESEGCAFDYFSIPERTYDELSKENGMTGTELREKVLSNLDKVHVSENLIKTEVNSIKRFAPSHLEEENNAVVSYSAKESRKDLYRELSEILKEEGSREDEDNDEDKAVPSETRDEIKVLDKKTFSAADFGTLVHDFLNKMCLGIKAEQYDPPPALYKGLKDTNRERIKNICVQMCTDFASTVFYKEFTDARRAGRFSETEMEFKYFNKNVLYTGSIDLIYQKEDGNYVIVDYKTDRIFNPEKHYLQQQCYKEAAEDIVPGRGAVTCFLYYLRFNEGIELNI